jgi:hypothetical protein
MPVIEGTLKEKAWSVDRAKGWDVAFILDPWRKQDGPWSDAPVYVYIPAGTERKAESLARRYKGRSAVRVTVTSVRPQGDYIARAQGKLPITKISGGLSAPPKKKERTSFRDEVLGTLKLEREFDWVSTRRFKVDGTSIELAIAITDPDDEVGITKTIAKARVPAAHCQTNIDKIRDAVTKKLLPLYNGKWREKDSPELRAKAFRSKVSKPMELHISPTQVMTLRLHASGLFTDHAIEVQMSARGRITAISIA